MAERLQCLLVEQDAKDGFSGDGFLQPYFTTVLLGDVLGQGKSQAYSVFLAGAYERLEECFRMESATPGPESQILISILLSSSPSFTTTLGAPVPFLAD